MSKRGVVLHGRAREIICNVDKYFESEKQHSVTLIHELKIANISSGPDGNIIMTRKMYASILQTLQNASKVTERVVLATGINKNTLTRIRREWRDAEASSSKITTPKKKKQGVAGVTGVVGVAEVTSVAAVADEPGRIPSPRELAAHTQNIMQGALIKKKLKEPGEDFRRSHELQTKHAASHAHAHAHPPQPTQHTPTLLSGGSGGTRGSGSMLQQLLMHSHHRSLNDFPPQKMTDSSSSGKNAMATLLRSSGGPCSSMIVTDKLQSTDKQLTN